VTFPSNRREFLGAIAGAVLVPGMAPAVPPADDAACGPLFVMQVPPYVRRAVCWRCWTAYPPAALFARAGEWSLRDMAIVADCPHCGVVRPHVLVDRPAAGAPRLKFWNPFEVAVVADPRTGRRDHVWRIPEYFDRLVRAGTPFHVARAPLGAIAAVRGGYDPIFGWHLMPLLTGAAARAAAAADGPAALAYCDRIQARYGRAAG
jgi:hypothetical protein